MGGGGVAPPHPFPCSIPTLFPAPASVYLSCNSFFQDALNLGKRPFAHNTSFILGILTAMCVLWYIIPPLRENTITRDIPLMFMVSMLSHHLRDADRRGLWCAPFGATAAIPRKLYIVLVLLIPLCVLAVPLVVRRLRQLASFSLHKQKVHDVYNA